MAGLGLGIALLLAILIRPLVVALCLAPFRYLGTGDRSSSGGSASAARCRSCSPPTRCWSGRPARTGSSTSCSSSWWWAPSSPAAPWPGRRGGSPSSRPEPPAPQALLAIESRVPLEGDLMSFYIDDALVVCGLRLDELDFPEGAVGRAHRPGRPAGAAQGRHAPRAGRPRVFGRPGGGPAVHSADVRKAGRGLIGFSRT